MFWNVCMNCANEICRRLIDRTSTGGCLECIKYLKIFFLLGRGSTKLMEVNIIPVLKVENVILIDYY